MRFSIPAPFDTRFPIGIKPETISHFETFLTGNSSVGRAEEGASLNQTAAYSTLANNSLNNLAEDFLDLNLFETVPQDRKGPLQEALNKISTIQVVKFGIYELPDSRYELLCGRQGASGVTVPELRSATIDAPAAYSSAGHQAYRRQQLQAIKYAFQRAGCKNPTGSRSRSGGGGSGRGRGKKQPTGGSGGGRGGGGRGCSSGKFRYKDKGKH